MKKGQSQNFGTEASWVSVLNKATIFNVEDIEAIPQEVIEKIKVGDIISSEGVSYLITFFDDSDLTLVTFDSGLAKYVYYVHNEDEGFNYVETIRYNLDTSDKANIWITENGLEDESFYTNQMKIGDILVDIANDRIAILRTIQFEEGELHDINAYGISYAIPFEMYFDSEEGIIFDRAQFGTKLYEHLLDDETYKIKFISPRATPLEIPNNQEDLYDLIIGYSVGAPLLNSGTTSWRPIYYGEKDNYIEFLSVDNGVVDFFPLDDLRLDRMTDTVREL